MQRWSFAIFALAACADVDPPQSIREPDLAGDDTHVQGGSFRVELSQTGVRLPTAITVGSTQLLRQGSCPGPSLAGVAIAPFESVTGGQDPKGTPGNSVVVQESGPAMMQYTIGYGVPYQCGGSQVLRGTTTLSIYPSGKIVRNDSIQPVSTVVADASACIICGTTRTATAVDSFWSFDGERFIVQNDADMKSTGLENLTEGCAIATGSERVGAAVSWMGAQGEFPSDTQGGVSFTNAHLMAGNGLSVGDVSTTSVVALGVDRDCKTLLPRTRMVPLELDDMNGGEPLALDPKTGIYTPTVPFEPGHFEIRGVNFSAVPGDFAVRLDLGKPPLRHIQIKMRLGDLPGEYRIQDVNAQPVLLWFAGGLADGDAYQIFVYD